MSASRRLVFVVGCPRSGTSPFARWLVACGKTTAHDERRHERYPAGYFEHLPVLMFQRALERLPRGAEHRITTEPYLTSDLLEDPFIRSTFEAAFEPVFRREIDFLKYPQLAMSIDFLLEQFENVHVVGVWRDPAPVFRSLVTREFPYEMIPASGVKAVLLWSLYARHLVEARRKHPRDVTLVDMQGFLDDPSAGPALLERLGWPADDAVPVEQAVNPELWNRPLSLPWRLYHRAMAAGCRVLRGRLGPQRESLADQQAWLRELRAATDFGGRRGPA